MKKLIGITPSGDHNYARMKSAGVRWLRFGLGFPFREQPDVLHERFESRMAEARRLSAMGFGLLGSTGSPGSMRYDTATGTTIWHRGLPAWAGAEGSREYCAAYARGCSQTARLARGLVERWQIANEPDIDIFRGPLTDDQIVAFLLAGARGVKRGNPAAQTGINLGFISDYSRMLVKRLYRIRNSPFDYIGLDGYFGSWQSGGPQDWVAYIDEATELAGVPALINEWGYSSLGAGPVTDDPQRRKRYNQDVCLHKHWARVWKKEHSPAEQAEYITECMAIFSSHRRVLGNFFFKWSDDATCWQCGQPQCPAEVAWGLVGVDGKPKPAYRAYAKAVAKLS